jgi:hypothetical protein
MGFELVTVAGITSFEDSGVHVAEAVRRQRSYRTSQGRRR